MQNLTRKMEDDTLLLLDGPEQVFSMRETLDEEQKKVSIVVTGSLKNDSVHDFGDELLAIAGFGLDIRLSLEGATYISHGAMRALLDVQKRLDTLGQGSLTLEKVPKEVLKAMESTGITELLMIEE